MSTRVNRTTAKLATPKAPAKTSKKTKDQAVCDLCTGSFGTSEEQLQCEGSCQKYMHRNCAGLTRSYYQQLSSSCSPFVCFGCTLNLQKTTVLCLQATVDKLKDEVADLRNQLPASNTNKECTCKDAISSIQGDIQHLQSVVDNNAFSYAEIVKKVELKQKQHSRRKS